MEGNTWIFPDRFTLASDIASSQVLICFSSPIMCIQIYFKSSFSNDFQSFKKRSAQTIYNFPMFQILFKYRFWSQVVHDASSLHASLVSFLPKPHKEKQYLRTVQGNKKISLSNLPAHVNSQRMKSVLQLDIAYQNAAEHFHSSTIISQLWFGRNSKLTNSGTYFYYLNCEILVNRPLILLNYN